MNHKGGGGVCCVLLTVVPEPKHPLVMDIQYKGVSQNKKAPLGNYLVVGVICNILCYEATLCSTFG